MNGSVGGPDSARHPFLDDLVAFTDDELDADERAAISTHLHSCAECRDTVSAVVPLDDVDSDAEIPGSWDAERPQLVPLVLAEPSAGPSAGEVWTAQWSGDAYLVVLVTVRDRVVDTVGVTLESPSRSSGWVVPIELATPGPALFAWPTVRASLPVGVLSQVAGPLTAASLTRATATTPAGRQPGWGDLSLLHDLEAGLAELAAVVWVPTVEGAAPSVKRLLTAQALQPSTLAARTGRPASAWTEILRETREPTDDEAAELASILELPVEAVRRPPNIPADLAAVIEQPSARSRIRRRAAQRSVSEGAERIQLAQQLLAVAARTTTSRRDRTTWEGLLADVLDD